MGFGFAAADGDVFARMPEVVPAAIKSQRAQHEIGMKARFFRDPHLGAVKAAENDVQNVAGREVVQVAIQPGAHLVHALAVALGAFPFQFVATRQVGRRGNGVHRNDTFDTHLLQNIDRKGIGNSAVHIKSVPDRHRGARSRNGAAGVHGGGDLAVRKDSAFERIEVGGDDAQRTKQLGKMRFADGALQPSFHFLAAEEPLARKNERVD